MNERTRKRRRLDRIRWLVEVVGVWIGESAAILSDHYSSNETDCQVFIKASCRFDHSHHEKGHDTDDMLIQPYASAKPSRGR